MTTISVIMPAYNTEKFIGDAIQSVISQTYSDFELIIVNDGSTDKTLEIAQNFAEKDGRIRIVNQNNHGVAYARNVALNIAVGGYIAFLDSDDKYAPTRLQRCVEVIESLPALSIIFHNLEYLSEDGDCKKEFYLNKRNFLKKAEEYIRNNRNSTIIFNDRFYIFMCLYYTGAHISTIFIRRDVEDRKLLRFRNDLPVVEDSELWIRLAEGEKIGYFDEALSFYRYNSLGISKNKLNTMRGSIKLHKEKLNEYKEIFTEEEVNIYRNKIFRFLFDLSYEYYNSFCMLQARSYCLEAFQYSINAKAIGLFLKTFIPHGVLVLHRKWRESW